MSKFFTKIIGATLAFAMMIGGAVGINANKQAKELNADTGSYTLTFDANTKNDGTGSHLGSDHSTALTTANVLSYATYSFKSGSTYYWLVAGSQYVTNVSSTENCYPGASQTIKVGKAAGDGTINFTIGEAGLSITSLVITARGADNTVKLTVDEATEATRTQDLTDSFDEYTFTYGSDVRTISLTGGAGKTSKNKVAYLSQIVINYSISQGSNYIVSFNSNGGTTVDSQSVSNSGSATADVPTAPTKRGYSFAGWYNEALTEAYDFDTPVTGDITLYAKWDKASAAAEYSPTMANGDYRILGEVTAITGSTDFFVQSGDNVVRVNSAPGTIVAGNSVDLFGTFSNSSGKISNLAYCESTSNDTNISQTPITDLDDVVVANKFKYFTFTAIQLGSVFSSNSATVKDRELSVYYASSTYVNGGAFTANSFAANDYVTIKGVITEYNSNLQLQITFIEKLTQYTVTFVTNGGTSIPSQNVLAGETVSQPTDPTKASDEQYNYTFAGWYTDEEFEHAYDFDSVVNESFPLYAKWNATELSAKQVVENIDTAAALSYDYIKDEDTTTDTLVKSLFGISGSGYKTWSGKQDESDAVYAGNCVGNVDYIQLKSNDSVAGIVTTASGGFARKITIAWNNSTTDGRVLDVYGKNTAYTAATNLYNDSLKGTKLGSITCGTSTELTITGDYAYIGLRSNSGAMYIDSISIDWGNVSYTYSNVAITFGGFVSTSLWERLNSESTIEGYGFLFSTDEFLDTDELKDFVEMADGTTVINAYKPLSQKAHPDQFYASEHDELESDTYIWSLTKRVSPTVAKLRYSYAAVAYIKTTTDGYVFFRETRASAKSLAQDMINTSAYDATSFNGSLNDLATL